MNYHRLSYIKVPSWYRYDSYSEYRVGGGWNYERFEVINYYTGGY